MLIFVKPFSRTFVVLLEFRWERNSSELRLKLKQSEAYSGQPSVAGPGAPCFTRYHHQAHRRAVRKIGQRRKQALPRQEVVDEQVVRNSVLCSLKSGLAGFLLILTEQVGIAIN